MGKINASRVGLGILLRTIWPFLCVMEASVGHVAPLHHRRLPDPEQWIRRLAALVSRSDPEHHPSGCRQAPTNYGIAAFAIASLV